MVSSVAPSPYLSNEEPPRVSRENRAGSKSSDSSFPIAYEFTNALLRTPTLETLDFYFSRFREVRLTYPLNAPGRCNWTVMCSAIKTRSLPLVRALLDKDPQLANSSGGHRETPYICMLVAPPSEEFPEPADPEFALEAMKLFVSKGGNVNWADSEWRTPLFLAASNEELQGVVHYLLGKKALMYTGRALERGDLPLDLQIKLIETVLALAPPDQPAPPGAPAAGSAAAAGGAAPGGPAASGYAVAPGGPPAPGSAAASSQP